MLGRLTWLDAKALPRSPAFPATLSSAQTFLHDVGNRKADRTLTFDQGFGGPDLGAAISVLAEISWHFGLRAEGTGRACERFSRLICSPDARSSCRPE